VHYIILTDANKYTGHTVKTHSYMLYVI